MVTLNTAFGLCSLIDQQGGLLHVLEDEDDCALVTLGKNIVIRYRLSDQKQLNSWSTIAQLSSKVVYDITKSTYLGIFNENTIKHWNQDDTNLDKVARIKLKEAAHEVLLDEEPVLVLKSGACCKLSYFENKSYEPITGFLPNESNIIWTKIIGGNTGKYLIVLALIDKLTICYSVPLDGDLKSVVPSLRSLKLRRRNIQFVGSCYLGRDNESSLVTLWSDGFLYSLPLPLAQEASNLPMGQFIGVVRAISTSSPVALTSLGPHHLAMYGGDPAEEGAVLAVYNVNFGMVQASTSFKMLQKPPRVWAVHERLLVGLGQRLVCVPYTLQTDSVAALVGTRPAAPEVQTDDVLAVMSSIAWENDAGVTPELEDSPAEIRLAIDGLNAQGCSEAGICETIISKLIDKQEVANISWCLEHFIDIPEELITRLLQFGLTAPDEIFRPALKKLPKEKKSQQENAPLVNGGSPTKNPSKNKIKVVEIIGFDGEFHLQGNAEDNPIYPPERAAFLNRIFKVPANWSSLVVALRRGLSIANCICLLKYFTHVISTGTTGFEQSIINWSIAMLDAFYQQLILGRYTQCIDSVLTLKKKVDEEIFTLNELKDTLPIVSRLQKQRALLKNRVQSKTYSIQKFQLYQ